MIHVFYSRITEVPSVHIIQSLVSKLPNEMQLTFNAFFKQDDQLRFLVGRLVLVAALKKQKLPTDLNFMKKNVYGKPFMENLPAFYFNISHAGEFVVCAFSMDQPLGIDIELIHPIELQDFKDFIPIPQWETIIEDRSWNKFYRYWTTIESVLKANGKGFSTPINDLIFLDNKINIEPHTFEYTHIQLSEKYACTLATLGKMNDLQLHSIPLSELFS